MKFDPNGSGKLRAEIKVTLPLSSRSQRTSGTVWAPALLTPASYMSTCLNTGLKKTLHEQVCPFYDERNRAAVNNATNGWTHNWTRTHRCWLSKLALAVAWLVAWPPSILLGLRWRCVHISAHNVATSVGGDVGSILSWSNAVCGIEAKCCKTKSGGERDVFPNWLRVQEAVASSRWTSVKSRVESRFQLAANATKKVKLCCRKHPRLLTTHSISEHFLQI